ncbi:MULTISPECIES: hypothetical protein [unclassified Pseudodesulfovibrio]|uniref:hypothetical protein n=1 Tax=unclassified Pseudodesulfovibrio TaxID=2661612 RepID=UPI000FEBCE15|nr:MULTISPECIES: hypothetical protein [unclassified Pseudodesulfovibrio]MCJ2165676.1 hypothetical protein [Pseudodesulfovibrio sp. S3-i]RWU02941.1 hypothetical protein DWB63_13635 [Pseudodesulfovibrio sp. S3]
MPCQLEFTDRDAFLQVDARGSIDNFEDLAGYVEAVLAEAERLGSKCILLQEQELTGHATCFDAVILSKRLTESLNGFPRRRVAVVCAQDNRPVARTFETVLLNRGFRYRMFTDVKSASHWLTA